MATKKSTTSYSEYEISFLERKLKELEEYIEDNPFNTLDDRFGQRMGKDGPIEYVIATRESQRKDLTAAIKEYAEILKLVDSIREKEEKKINARGGHDVSYRAKRLVDKE